MANRLIRYDLALLRRFLADGFRGSGDVVLAAIMIAIAFLWLRQQMLVLPNEAKWFALLAGPAGFAWQRLVSLRLAMLAAHSPVAPLALNRREWRAWFAAAHLLVGLPVLAGTVLLGMATGQPWPAIGLAAAAYGAGAGLSSVIPALRRRGRPARARPAIVPLGNGRPAVLRLIIARQGLALRSPLVHAGLLLAASAIVTAIAGWCGPTLLDPLALILPFLPPLLVLLLATRLDSALLAYLPAAGYGPGFIALAVSALPAGGFLAAGAAFLLTGQSIGAIAVLALGHLVFILIGIARAWLYPGRTKRSVDLQIQLELTGLVAVATILPPLAVAATGWRFWHFCACCRAKRWMHA